MESLPNLLRLPQELRDEIYAYALHPYGEPPDRPSVAGVRTSEGTLRYLDSKDLGCSCYHSLAGTSRQLREEVRYYASNLRTSNCRSVAELDLMFFDFVSFPTWIYFPLVATREKPFDLKVHFRIFSEYTFREYDDVRNSDGWQYGTMSAPFLDFLILLRRLVRCGPSFASPSSSNDDKLSGSKGITTNFGFFRFRNLIVDITYRNAESNRGNNSNIIKCFRTLARTGLARGAIEQIRFRWRFRDHLGSLREHEKVFDVMQELDEDHMELAVKRGFCHTATDSLFDGPLENGEAVIDREPMPCVRHGPIVILGGRVE